MRVICFILILFRSIICQAQSQEAAIKIEGSGNSNLIKQQYADSDQNKVDSQRAKIDLKGDNNYSQIIQGGTSTDGGSQNSKDFSRETDSRKLTWTAAWEFVTNMNNLAGLIVSLSVLFGLVKGVLLLRKKRT